MIPFTTFTTPGGEELVVVPRAEFERLTAIAAEVEEDADDLRTYLDAKAAIQAGGFAPFPPDLSALLLEHKSRIEAVRRWRGLTRPELAERAALTVDQLQDIEIARSTPDSSAISRLASALNVAPDWLA